MSLEKTYNKVKGNQTRLDEELEMIARLGLTKEQKNSLFKAAGEAMVKLPAEKFVAIMQACCPDTVVDGTTHSATVEKLVNESSIEDMRNIVEAMADSSDDEEETDHLLEMLEALTEQEPEVEQVEQIAIEESLKAIFGSDLLTEETQEKLTTLFEAAINEKVALKTAAIEAQLEEEMGSQVEQLVDTLDAYLEEAVDSFFAKNQIAIETGIRVEMMESFMGGIKSLVEQHNFAIETDQVDMVQELSTKVEDLEARLDESLNTQVALKREIEAGDKAAALADAGRLLTVGQQEKLSTLAEDLEFTSKDKYAAKLKVIVEQYFPTTTEKTTEVVAEGLLTEETAEVAPKPSNIYAAAISRTVKK